MSDVVKELSDKDGEDFLKNSEKPVLIDFYAPWCGPCLAIAPLFETYASLLKDKFNFAKYCIDKPNGKFARKLGIRTIPTIILFEAGEEKKRVCDAYALKEMIESLKS